MKLVPTLVALGSLALLGWALRERLAGAQEPPAAADAPRAVPVEVAPFERGPITLRRVFSGALEATAEFGVAPKVSGRLERLTVDLGDRVARGQVVAWLDDAEFVQAEAQAQADVAVARANRTEAESALEIAGRALKRFETLREQGVTSESEYDAARADELARRASLAVSEAQVTRAEAALETARIRLGYTKVAAGWSGGDDERVVGERFVDEGSTVAANVPVLSIVELDPIVAVVFVPERDYARLAPGLPARLATDAYPGEAFAARIERIAPIFRQSTRQVRVELVAPNPDQRLKPGMFVRVEVELERLEDALLAPVAALTERGGEPGVFVLDAAASTVRWRPVAAGIVEGERVAVLGEGLEGAVVTLGQDLCDDGARVLASPRPEAAAALER